MSCIEHKRIDANFVFPLSRGNLSEDDVSKKSLLVEIVDNVLFGCNTRECSAVVPSTENDEIWELPTPPSLQSIDRTCTSANSVGNAIGPHPHPLLDKPNLNLTSLTLQKSHQRYTQENDTICGQGLYTPTQLITNCSSLDFSPQMPTQKSSVIASRVAQSVVSPCSFQPTLPISDLSCHDNPLPVTPESRLVSHAEEATRNTTPISSHADKILPEVMFGGIKRDHPIILVPATPVSLL